MIVPQPVQYEPHVFTLFHAVDHAHGLRLEC